MADANVQDDQGRVRQLSGCAASSRRARAHAGTLHTAHNAPAQAKNPSAAADLQLGAASPEADNAKDAAPGPSARECCRQGETSKARQVQGCNAAVHGAWGMLCSAPIPHVHWRRPPADPAGPAYHVGNRQGHPDMTARLSRWATRVEDSRGVRGGSPVLSPPKKTLPPNRQPHSTTSVGKPGGDATQWTQRPELEKEQGMASKPVEGEGSSHSYHYFAGRTIE